MSAEPVGETPAPVDGEPPAPRRRRIPWGRVIVSVVVLAAAAAIAIGLANRNSAAPAVAPLTPAAERPAAPAFTLPVLQATQGIGPEGSRLALADLRGRVVVVNFWAWWCSACREEIPVLQRASERYDPQRVLFLGINSEDVLADARKFLVTYPFEYPSVRDAGPGAAKAFGLYGYPSTIVIDPQGRIAARYSGAVEDPEQVTDPIDRVLAES